MLAQQAPDWQWHGPDIPLPQDGTTYLWLDEQGLHLAPDWREEAPPLIWPDPLPAHPDFLTGLAALHQGQWEACTAAWEAWPVLLQHLQDLRWMVWGQGGPAALPASPEAPFSAYRQAHNRAVQAHFAPQTAAEARAEYVGERYARALALAPDLSWHAYTLRLWASWLIDQGEYAQLMSHVAQLDPEALPAPAYHALLSLRCRAQLLQTPYEAPLPEALKTDLRACMNYFQGISWPIETSLLLMDAAQIAEREGHFAEALGYLNQALSHLEEEAEDLKGQALLQKGMLLFAWTQADQPQFCQPAIEALQAALGYFPQDQAPAVFADIHHHLGILYAERPASPEKAALWAAVSASSFREALAWYTREQAPYQYGVICNNYGNALTRYRGSERADYFQKALDYYREALSVRDQRYPYERAITLLNFLEASWKVGNPEGFNHDRYEDMRAKVEEVRSLVSEPDLLAEAQRHADGLDQLMNTISA
ncbi:MAG: hypothetical protein D6722_23065 [Bacteroidetes bacterium]|nr:MAG: hypothetical protein D6722_23065 [Bacteroidota bacterium]